jgi:hypothetical protein
MAEFAGVERRLPFTGALEPVLRQIAAGFGWRVVGGKGFWTVSGGDWLATNPNDVRWSGSVTHEGEVVVVRGDRSVLPWTRERQARIVTHRVEQLAALLGSPRPLTHDDRRPFARGATPADHCFTFAGLVGTVVLIMTAVMTTTTLASWLALDGTMADLRARAATSARLGLPVLPPQADLDGLGAGGRLAAAALLAMPIAFFFGLLHSLAHVLGEFWWRASRLPAAATLMTAGLGALAFGSASLLAGVAAVLTPAAAALAISAAWGRRDLKPREPAGPGPRKIVVVAAVLLVLAVAGALLPWPRKGTDFTDTLALFRDRYLLTHGVGRAYSHLYYRVTLYSAEAVKPAFDGKDVETAYEKLDPLALVLAPGPTPRAILRELGFIPVDGDPSMAADRAFDIVVAAGPVEGAGTRLVVVPGNSDPAAWRAAVLGAVKKSFRGGWMLELVQAGWQSIYFAGALFGLALLMAPLALAAGVMYRRTTPRGATVSVGAVFLLTVVVLVVIAVDRSPQLEALAKLRRADAAGLQEALASPFASVRHEAAYRIYRHVEKPAAGPLVQAYAAEPDDRVKLWLCGALGKSRDRLALGTLAGATADPELLVRYRAVEGLGLLEAGKGKLADPQVVNVLTAVLKDGSWYEAMYAINALRRIDPSRWPCTR